VLYQQLLVISMLTAMTQVIVMIGRWTQPETPRK